jgi:hypothetical protein
MRAPILFALVFAVMLFMGCSTRLAISPPAADGTVQQRIYGTVRLPDGRPAAGLPMMMTSAYCPGKANPKTDAKGRFGILMNVPTDFIEEHLVNSIFIWDEAHNLVVVWDSEFAAGTTNLDLTLAPGLTLTGHVVSDGKTVTNATTTLIYYTGADGTSLSYAGHTNAPGYFEFSPLPPGKKYGLYVSVPGYGTKLIDDIKVSASPIRQELGPVEIKLAK